MRPKLLVLGSLAAGFALFAWQTISQVVLPWHEATMSEFTNAPAVVSAIRAGAPENGMYFAGQGVLAAVSFTPTMADKTSGEPMGPMLAAQLATDLIIASLLCVLLLAVPHLTPALGGRIAAIAASAAALTVHVSNWIWYGFSPAYVIVNSVDLVIGWSIAGAVLGLIIRRMTRADVPAASATGATAPGDVGPRAGSLRPPAKHAHRHA